jgi:hypothetical protein
LEKGEEVEEEEEEEECSICLDLIEDRVRTPCNHHFCRLCIEAVLTGR